MTRWARRTDLSQRGIIDALVSVGLAVRDLSFAGRGTPDLLVAAPGGRLATVEAKTPGTSRGKRLTEAERAWLAGWPGPHVVLRTADEAVQWGRAFREGREGPSAPILATNAPTRRKAIGAKPEGLCGGANDF